MTLQHITHASELPLCKAGHRARHIFDHRCARAGGGHFIECACAHTRRFAEFELAQDEWRKRFAKRARPKRRSAPVTDTVVQFPLQLQGGPRRG